MVENEKTWPLRPKDIYGAQWFNMYAGVLAKWEWEFRPAKAGETLLHAYTVNWEPLKAYTSDARTNPRIILIRKKKEPAPRLEEYYAFLWKQHPGYVEIPAGYEWTGEFRCIQRQELALGRLGNAETFVPGSIYPFLILRPTALKTKVWFKAEAEVRLPKKGDWYFYDDDDDLDAWQQAVKDFNIYTFLCATRVEEPDTTPTRFTQEDVDKAWTTAQEKEEQNG